MSAKVAFELDRIALEQLSHRGLTCLAIRAEKGDQIAVLARLRCYHSQLPMRMNGAQKNGCDTSAGSFRTLLARFRKASCAWRNASALPMVLCFSRRLYISCMKMPVL